VGDRLTIADIYLASDLRIARSGKLIAAEDQPFASFLERLEGRPAFIRAAKVEVASRDVV
jgi:glutathione S-transferase